MQFTWQIPPLNGQGDPIAIDLTDGSAVFVVGANGSGKSALITQLTKAATAINTIRIAAHRQSWLQSSSVDLTLKTRKDLQISIDNRDRQDESRWKDDYAQPRTQVALFDLANAQNTVSRSVLDLLKQGSIDEATSVAKQPSPLEAMNDILSVSTLTVRLSISEDGDILAQHGDGPTFSISLLSDGERNAVMLAAQVLTANPETLFLIDEPERHLHRAITEPMLTALFEKRKDCAFVVATHEPELPNCNPEAPVVIIRGCSWSGSTASGWDLDILDPGVDVPDDIRRALLGSRRRLLFIEGETQSLDYPLISALFPSLSIKPTGSCREVERSVVGLTGAAGLHWLNPLGLVDRDDRSDKEVEALAERNIFALEVSAIESIFYSGEAIAAIASLQAGLFGLNEEELKNRAVDVGLTLFDDDVKETLAARRSEKSARNRLMSSLPDWRVIRENRGQNIEISTTTNFDAELELLNNAISANDLDAITSRYAVKKTRIPAAVAETLRFSNQRHYEEAVVTLAKNDEAFRNTLRAKLGALTSYLEQLDRG